MSKFVAFTSLQKQLGQESAEAVAEFVEAQHQESSHTTATKEDLLAVKVELLREIAKLREDIARTETNIIKEISGKYSWLVAVLSALGVIITLINKFLPG